MSDTRWLIAHAIIIKIIEHPVFTDTVIKPNEIDELIEIVKLVLEKEDE